MFRIGPFALYWGHKKSPAFITLSIGSWPVKLYGLSAWETFIGCFARAALKDNE